MVIGWIKPDPHTPKNFIRIDRADKSHTEIESAAGRICFADLNSRRSLPAGFPRSKSAPCARTSHGRVARNRIAAGSGARFHVPVRACQEPLTFPFWARRRGRRVFGFLKQQNELSHLCCSLNICALAARGRAHQQDHRVFDPWGVGKGRKLVASLFERVESRAITKHDGASKVIIPGHTVISTVRE
jgi:hypothetical protein